MHSGIFPLIGHSVVYYPKCLSSKSLVAMAFPKYETDEISMEVFKRFL